MTKIFVKSKWTHFKLNYLIYWAQYLTNLSFYLDWNLLRNVRWPLASQGLKGRWSLASKGLNTQSSRDTTATLSNRIKLSKISTLSSTHKHAKPLNSKTNYVKHWGSLGTCRMFNCLSTEALGPTDVNSTQALVYEKWQSSHIRCKHE